MGENVLPMDCSDPAYVSTAAQRISLDRAARTTVARNTFRDVVYGVRVEDDGTTVAGNRFIAGSDSSYAVIVGTPYRTSVLAQPVRDTSIIGNRAAISGNPSPYRWVDGETGTVFTRNVADDVPVGWCSGADLPRGSFVFVIAVAFEPPGSPVTPPPDLTVPVVGPQPACTATTDG